MTMNTDSLLSRMEDLADAAMKTGRSASRFLTPEEAGRVADRFGNGRASLTFYGGFEDAERARAVFTNPDWGEGGETELIAALRVEYRPQDSLGHRDILGALMALGIERDTIGDIAGGEGAAALTCLPELSGYIADNLTKAGRVGVKVSRIRLDELPSTRETPTVKTDSVASLRLDAVLCAAFGLSRSRAAELVAAGRVSVDHRPCLQPSAELDEGALMSVRGLGRARLMEIGGASRKGRTFVRIGTFPKP
jgi:RNA-binding protein YlmH